jgi:hypothetical protein
MKNAMKSVSDWLGDHTDQMLFIQKKEQDDLDEVKLRLARIDYRGENADSLDGYTADSALLLYGSGTIINNGAELPLPSDLFEIPLAGLSNVRDADDRLVLETERATYSLSKRE